MYTEHVQDGREGPSISNTNYSSDYKHGPWKRMLHFPNTAIIEAFSRPLLLHDPFVNVIFVYNIIYTVYLCIIWQNPTFSKQQAVLSRRRRRKYTSCRVNN